MNYYNDGYSSDPNDQSEWTLVLFSISKHRHYEGESFRELLDLEKFEAPAQNAFGIPTGFPVYTAIVKIYAPINGKLVIGLKEMILVINNGKPVVIADRIRL
jgi:hypothetical protein